MKEDANVMSPLNIYFADGCRLQFVKFSGWMCNVRATIDDKGGRKYLSPTVHSRMEWCSASIVRIRFVDEHNAHDLYGVCHVMPCHAAFARMGHCYCCTSWRSVWEKKSSGETLETSTCRIIWRNFILLGKDDNDNDDKDAFEEGVLSWIVEKEELLWVKL